MSLTVTGHATLDGQPYTATATLTVIPPTSTAVVGASLGQPLAVDQVLPAVRFYSATWGAKLKAEYAAGTRVFVVSTKDATPANMVAMVKAAPADVLFYLTVNHEPDDNIRDGTLLESTYAAKLNAFGQALAPFPNVRFGPIHNGSFGRAGWEADEVGADKSLWTFWGEDRYCFNYEDPAAQFAEGRDYAASLGLPLLIGETAAPRNDVTKQQTVASQVRAWTLDPANGACVVCWWQSIDSTRDLTFANAAVQHAFLG